MDEIARVLAALPDILLMGEHFGAVDEIARSFLQDEIKRILQETRITILFVTHDIKESLKLGTKVLFLDQGEIQQFNTSQNIINKHKSFLLKNL